MSRSTPSKHRSPRRLSGELRIAGTAAKGGAEGLLPYTIVKSVSHLTEAIS